jgi:hypothetical protein
VKRDQTGTFSYRFSGEIQLPPATMNDSADRAFWLPDQDSNLSSTPTLAKVQIGNVEHSYRRRQKLALQQLIVESRITIRSHPPVPVPAVPTFENKDLAALEQVREQLKLLLLSIGLW